MSHLGKFTFKRIIEENNPNKSERIKELGQIGLGQLNEKVQNAPSDLWEGEDDDHINDNKKGVLNKVRHITFRFSDKDTNEYFHLPIWDEWKSTLLPIMDEATAKYGYENYIYPRVMIASLPPGCVIMPHSDGGVKYSRPHKIHIPIQTNEKALFLHPPAHKYNLKAGYGYEINNCINHGVVNKGDNDRIHLIFEMIPLKPDDEKIDIS